MGIYRSTNPTDWSAVDGIIIDEVAPPSSVGGVPSNTAILVGAFERGPVGSLQSVGSVQEFYEIFGNNLNFTGNIALVNKKFGSLKVVRAAAAAAVKGTKGFSTSATLRITFTALYFGVYGNSIQVTVAAGTTAGSKYTIHDSNSGAVYPDEVYDNVLITSSVATLQTLFGNSKLVGVPVIASSAAEPDVAAATNLISGSDGSIADTDYQTAIVAQQTEAAGNIVFLDSYNATRNGYLKTSMAATTDRMAVLSGAAGDSAATAISAVATLRDTDGRLIYAFPYVYTTISGVSTRVNPASFYASLLSQVGPHIDPAWAMNTQYLAGIDSLELSLQRSDYVSLAAAGISAFEVDSDIGIKVKSGVVTQIVDSAKIMVFRRRMADFLSYSVAKFLKAYQNAVNSASNRTNATAAIQAFNRQLELAGMVPSDSELSTGTASIVDGTSLNSNNSIAQGYFNILWKRRIYSSMRYIVLQAQIGTSVVVTAS
jgi:hypothetical protein